MKDNCRAVGLYAESYIFGNSSEWSNASRHVEIVAQKAPTLKPVIEDAGFASYDFKNDLFVDVVADGVTRHYYPKSNYSPAAIAARVVANTVGSKLLEVGAAISREGFIETLQYANNLVAQINKEEVYESEEGTTTLWEAPDYFEHDLAGTVSSAVVRQGKTLRFGFIGDCNILILDSSGEVKWKALTDITNRVHQSKQTSIKLRNLPEIDNPEYPSAYRNYRIKVHSEVRNNPQAQHPTYLIIMIFIC